MTRIGKWTGIALIGASVMALDGAVLYVGAGAAREFLASPEAHALSVASRVAGRALLHQAVGGAVRVAHNLRWAGVRGEPEALAIMGLDSRPDAYACGIWCDRSTERQIQQAQRELARMHRELMADRQRMRIQALADQAREQQQSAAAQRELLMQQVRDQVREQRRLIKERMRDSRATI